MRSSPSIGKQERSKNNKLATSVPAKGYQLHDVIQTAPWQITNKDYTLWVGEKHSVQLEKISVCGQEP